jgi:hypothetical protein
MKIDAAIQDISALSIDTAPLIYFIEKNPIYLDKMRFIIQLVDSGQISGFSSVVTLTEVLTQPKKLGDKLIEKEYLDLLLHSRNFTIQNMAGDGSFKKIYDKWFGKFSTRRTPAFEALVELNATPE